MLTLHDLNAWKQMFSLSLVSLPRTWAMVEFILVVIHPELPKY